MLSAETKEKLLKQFEFYFSDSNLPRDKFLRGKTQENPEGWVDLKIICAFTRVAQLFGHQRPPEGSVGSDAEVSQVAALLKEKSQQLIVSEDSKRVRRAAPAVSLDEAARQADERSLYVAPLPYNATLDVLTAFFSQEASVNAVRLRRHVVSKDFRGSVFVEFATREDAQKVVARQLVFEGAPLRMIPKLDFIQQKIEDRHAKAAANGHQAAVPAASDEEGAAPAAAAAAVLKSAPAPTTGLQKTGQTAVTGAAAMETAAAAAGAAAPASASHKRPAEAPVAQQASKRSRAEGNGTLSPALALDTGPAAPEWSGEPHTVAKFVFQQADKIPQARDLQMLRDSFGGPKAGIRGFAYTAGASEGWVRFSSKTELDTSLSQLAEDQGFVLLAGCPAQIIKNLTAGSFS